MTLAAAGGRERELLGHDLRDQVALTLPADARTGEPIPVCSVPALGYEYAIVAVDRGPLSVDLRRTAFDVDSLLGLIRDSGMPHADWWAGLWHQPRPGEPRPSTGPL